MEEHWTSKRNKISINSLKLWDENPRLSEYKSSSTDREIVRSLLEANGNSGLRALTNKIVDNGWQELESVVVIAQARKKGSSKQEYLVLEGNRRVSCLKLLNSPALALKPADKIFFARRRKDMGDSFSQIIRVCVAPDEEQAIKYVTARHTQRPIMMWDAGDNHRWIHSLYLKYDEDIESVSEIMGLDQPKIRAALTSIYLRDYVIDKGLLSTSDARVLQEESFPWSTLDRTISFSGFKDRLGLLFSDGVLSSTKGEEYFNGMLSGIFSRIAEGYVSPQKKGVITSRSCKNSVEANNFAEEIEASLPKDTGEHSTSVYPIREQSSTNTAQNEDETEEDIQPAKSGNGGKRSNGCLADGYEISTTDERICGLFNSLKKVSPRSHPDAVALVLRCLIELSAKHYIKKHERYPAFKKYAKNINQDPTLATAIKFLKAECSDILDPNLFKSFQMLQESGSLISLTSLNLVAHSEYHSMSTQELRDFWKRIGVKFFVELLSMAPEK
ncbi:hypothetical protein ACWPKO_02875 [Coraliomargarita sp. W4R53]